MENTQSNTEQLECIDSILRKLKGNIQDLNYKAAQLTIQLTSLYDPEMTERMNKNKELVKSCAEKCKSRINQQESDDKNDSTKINIVVSKAEE